MNRLTEFFARESVRGAAAFAISVAFYAAAMPGADVASLIWVWAVPPALWAATRPRWRTWIIFSAIASWLGGVLTLLWLRNLFPPLGWLAVLLLPLGYSAFPFLWMLALRFIFPNCSRGNAFVARLLGMLGLAGFWILLEWILTWFLSGFPWMPLGATQWERPAMLALCPFAGTAGASFAIIFLNLGVARYLRHLLVELREKPKELSHAEKREELRERAFGFGSNVRGAGSESAPSLFHSVRQICPEFYCSLVPVLLSVCAYWVACVDFARNNEKYFSFAAVQTDFDPQAKWDEKRVPESAEILEKLTLEAALSATPTPDFILWPEAALPFSVQEIGYRAWLEELSANAGKLIVLGGLQPGADAGTYYNSVHAVYPKSGLAPEFFAKRHLVPFGEYLPFADYLPFRKIVPAAADCLAGTSAEPMQIHLKKGSFAMGVLVCYEDVFPELGRDLVRNGADFLAVVTNDAWYGREAGAYQHAAHSVMQAVSLGVPVIRCGNAGWSGVINPLGHMVAMTQNGRAGGSVYFRGAQSFDVYGRKRPAAPAGDEYEIDEAGRVTLPDGGNAADARLTFYARHGNWLATLGGIFFALAYLRERIRGRVKLKLN